MIAVALASCVAPVILGRIKRRLAEQLHDKVLRADADMNRADWLTGLATAAGVVGIGMGWWWADAAAARSPRNGSRSCGTAAPRWTGGSRTWSSP